MPAQCAAKEVEELNGECCKLSVASDLLSNPDHLFVVGHLLLIYDVERKRPLRMLLSRSGCSESLKDRALVAASSLFNAVLHTSKQTRTGIAMRTLCALRGIVWPAVSQNIVQSACVV